MSRNIIVLQEGLDKRPMEDYARLVVGLGPNASTFAPLRVNGDGELLVSTTGAAGTLTATSTLVTTSGTVDAGARKVEFIFSADYTGNILGTAYTGAADAFVGFEAPAGFTINALSYTVTAGSIRINKLA